MELPSYPTNPGKQAYSQPYLFQPSQPIPQADPETQSIESQSAILQDQDRDQVKYQVQRWANWAKFFSIFLILNGLIGLIPTIYYLFFVEEGMNPDMDRMQLLNTLSGLFLIIVGASGCKASVKKTSRSVLCYMIMLLGEIPVSLYYVYVLIK